MKQKKMLAFSLVLALLASLFVVAPASAVTQQVSLLYAKPYYEGMAVGAEGYVEVENLSPNKVVTIHYSADGVTWKDTQAEYFKATQGNYEAWKFRTDSFSVGMRGSATVQFAIKYEVNGNTYWDNNNGANYTVKAGYGVSSQYDFGSTAVAMWYQSNVVDEKVNIYAQLKSLAYDKGVRVRYSTDNWATYEEVQGTFNYSFPDSAIESWVVSVPATQAFEYAISYKVNGTTYWDNNFGANYTFDPAA